MVDEQETGHSTLDPTALGEVVDLALSEARQRGASSAEAASALSQGLSINVRLGEIETVEHTRDRSLIVTVYFGKQTGSASTSDYGLASIKETVQAACNIASHTEADQCNGLADQERLATEFPDLDLYHPWLPSVDEARTLAVACEQAALEHDDRIENSEGATVTSHEGYEVYGTSTGFWGENRKTRHGVSCSVIGQGQDGMQRDYWYSSARRKDQMDSPEQVGLEAARRTIRRLDARKIKTCQVPVLFEAPVASSLLSHFIGAISGGALYRRASFLLNHIGKQVFPEFARIHEQPLLKGAMGSAAFDGEGVATEASDIVTDGVLQRYVLGSYSARRLGLETTGNAGGVHNLTIEPGKQDLADLITGLDTGFLVTELIGFGVNTVTGDYSRGASGFWIEQGEIQYPVEEVTVAGNLRDIFKNFVAVGRDVDFRRNVRCGSLLVDGLTVAGD